MISPLPVRRLAEMAEVLLNVPTSVAELKATADGLYDWFLSLVGLDPEPFSTDSIDTALPTGKALSPALAAMCVKDPKRTAVFLRGVEAAIREAQRRFPNQRIEILYAGTGPFAPLAFPLMTRFRQEEIRFTLIDIHERSIEAARALANHFGLSGYVRDFIVGDATGYVHLTGPLHLLVVETMQSALGKEPQVAIVRHLLPQLAPGGILVPERVAVDLVMLDAAAETQRAMGRPVPGVTPAMLGRVMELTAGTAELPLDEQGRFPPTVVRIPDLASLDRYWIAYLTSIEVFGQHSLGEYESGVTYPQIIWELSPKSGETLVFRYCTGTRPGLGWERVNRNTDEGLEKEPRSRDAVAAPRPQSAAAPEVA